MRSLRLNIDNCYCKTIVKVKCNQFLSRQYLENTFTLQSYPDNALIRSQDLYCYDIHDIFSVQIRPRFCRFPADRIFAVSSFIIYYENTMNAEKKTFEALKWKECHLNAIGLIDCLDRVFHSIGNIGFHRERG